eukprot:SAG31_NODE_998_length_10460_cov_255.143505_8_plen_91_part_00
MSTSTRFLQALLLEWSRRSPPLEVADRWRRQQQERYDSERSDRYDRYNSGSSLDHGIDGAAGFARQSAMSDEELAIAGSAGKRPRKRQRG